MDKHLTSAPVGKATDNFSQLKWIILVRIFFCIVLIFSSLVFSTGENLSFLSQPFVFLYYLTALILFLSVVYGIWLMSGNHLLLLAYCQIIADTLAVTAIIYVTGSYDSMFTFLYLVIIIYSAMLLFRKGCLIIAAISSIQYGLLIELEYYGIITPFMGQYPFSTALAPSHIFYRIILIMAACFVVALLSGILSLQLKRARQDLRITQAHIRRVEKMEALDEMMSGLAHEIKNPLASLAGSIQLLQEDAMPGSREGRLMQIILRETDRLKQIINDIGYFAKPGKTNATPVKLADAVKDVVALFSNTPGWKGRIHVTTRLDETLIVVIDPVHLQQILWNLVKNAAESIPDQGKIVIGLKSPRNNRIYLTIRDTGTGIETHRARHIFDPFYTTKPQGTGLGLSIIHRLVDTYNGMIDFESVPGKGSVFTIVFQKPQSLKNA